LGGTKSHTREFRLGYKGGERSITLKSRKGASRDFWEGKRKGGHSHSQGGRNRPQRVSRGNAPPWDLTSPEKRKKYVVGELGGSGREPGLWEGNK